MSIPLVQKAEKDDINTSIIAIKRNIERINMLLGLMDNDSPDLSGFATKQELQDAVESLQPVDEVTIGNMHSVTSNAVADAFSTRLDYVYNEVDTGIKWVNGKPIYRKVFYLSATLNTVSTSLLQNLNIEFLLRNDLHVWDSSQMYWVSNGILYNTKTKKISFSSTYSNSWVLFYIIEYTKTTDTATRSIPIEEPEDR